jgi:polyferredoxin
VPVSDNSAIQPTKLPNSKNSTTDASASTENESTNTTSTYKRVYSASTNSSNPISDISDIPLTSDTKSEDEGLNLQFFSADSSEYSKVLFSKDTIVLIVILAFGILIQVFKRLHSLRFFVVLVAVGYLGFVKGGSPCPVGSVSQFAIHKNMIFNVELIDWVIVFAIPVFITVFWGRVFCGMVCPLGIVQEFVFKLSSAYMPFLKKKVNKNFDRMFKYIKYICLIGLLWASYNYSSAVFCKICPYRYLYNFRGAEIALIVLIVFVIFFLFISRPFCRYLCPFGAILALTPRLFNKGKKNVTENCNGCGICTKSCPVDAIDSGKINTAECINCGDCHSICPVRKKERLNKKNE